MKLMVIILSLMGLTVSSFAEERIQLFPKHVPIIIKTKKTKAHKIFLYSFLIISSVVVAGISYKFIKKEVGKRREKNKDKYGFYIDVGVKHGQKS